MLIACGKQAEVEQQVQEADLKDTKKTLAFDPDTAVEDSTPPVKIPEPTNEGPFGIKKGMTWAELQPYKPMLKSGKAFELSSVPMPHEFFINHVVFLTKETGVCEILSSSNIVTTKENGEDLRLKFESIKQGLSEKYGPPTTNVDQIEEDSVLKSPNDWMLSIRTEDRKFKAYWISEDKQKYPNGIDTISLEVKAININNGIMLLNYEFDNLPECNTVWNAEVNQAL